MRTARRVFWAALAAACASLSLGGAAQAQDNAVYDGITYAQLKSALSQTNLGLAESATQKGNRYLVVTIEGGTAPFVASTMGCPDGQDATYEGFVYFYIDEKHRMNADAMAQFNLDTSFIKATPAIADPADVVIAGEFYARGGVAARHVIHAAAFYTATLETHLRQAEGAIAMNGRTATPAFTFAGRTRPEQFFAELAMRGDRRSAPTGANAPEIDEALIDALNSRRR